MCKKYVPMEYGCGHVVFIVLIQLYLTLMRLAVVVSSHTVFAMIVLPLLQLLLSSTLKI